MTQFKSDKHKLEENSKFKDGVNKNARLMVRNISFKATEDTLRDHFSKYGTVEEVKLLKKPDGKLVGCGFVHFTHVPMANAALVATNKKPFLGRPINVTWAIPKHKYAEQIQGNINNKLSEITSTETSTEEVSTGEPESHYEESTETKQEKKMRVNRNARLIVRNISFKATEESLQEHFKPYGDILEVKLLKKPDGKLVGCAFVHYKNVPMAKKALLHTNMKPYLGRPISVDWAVAKDKYMQHIVNRQTEMQEKVKTEDSDSDDDAPPLNSSNEALKDEIKSESDDDSEDGSDAESSDEKAASDDDDDDDVESGEEDDESDDEDDDENGDEDMVENESQVDPLENKRIKLNDAEDGCTVFLTNIPFSVDNNKLKQFAEATGPVKYALICMDKFMEHSKGSGFIKFENKEDADKFRGLEPEYHKLEGQTMLAKPALKRENLQKDNKKQAKDNRNLYLVKEGVIIAGTKAAEGVSSSDMSKRLALERSKTQMLKNLNRFVSRYRLVVSNLPAWCGDGKLRQICVEAAGRRAEVTEARVMRDLRAATGAKGQHPSKGYGFVMFTRHEDALACLRKLNNNPDIFDKNNRPIVSFSIEDRTALNARKKRLEKSIANNPVANKNSNQDNAAYNNRKRKSNMPPDESYVKKGRFNKNVQKNGPGNFQRDSEVGKFVRKPIQDVGGEYTGLTAKEGAQHKMRNSHKLRTQAQVHRETVKREKKTSKRAQRLKMAAKERIKLPKQKMNKNKAVKSRRNKNKKKFNDDY